MNDEEILKKLTSLAEDGHELAESLNSESMAHASYSNKMDNVNRFHLVQKWRGISSALLEYRFGAQSQYLKEFLIAIDSSSDSDYRFYRENVHFAASTLEYIFEILKEGLTDDFFYRKQLITFADLLQQAYYLVEKGLTLAGVIYGRLVLETTVKEYAKKAGITNLGFDQTIICLRTQGLITKPLENSLRANYEIGSWAAHNTSEFAKLSPNQIREFLDFVRDKVLTLN